MLSLGLALAVTGSVALNASYLLQHAGTRSAPAIALLHPARTVRTLLGSRWWLAGLLAGLAGWALHIGALAHAPLSLVQAFAAGGLVLTVPAAARLLGERLRRRDLVAGAAMVAALALLGLGSSTAAAASVPAAAMSGFLAACAVTAALLALAAPRSTRARALGAAGGILYGAGDAATKAVAVSAHGAGLGAALAGPWGAAVLIASGGAFLCFQRGLQLGPAVPVIALMTATTNVTAILGGVLVFGDALGTTLALAALHAGALGVAVAAGLVLASAQARLTPKPNPPPAGSGDRTPAAAAVPAAA